jgi:myo-inositol-1(or 4)-monophosphatase
LTFHAELAVARAAAEEAGALIAARWDTAIDVRRKGEVDLVSEVDLAAEEIVVERIATAFPDDGVLAEEGSGRQVDQARVWHVDPLDGTTNYSHGFPHFCVSIGLVDAAGAAVGVVHDPLRRWTFWAGRGMGAWRDGQRLHVSDVGGLDGALLATGFAYDRRQVQHNNVPELGALLRRCQGVRRAGAAALDLAYLAAGWVDGYWERGLKSWDVAAGVLLVSEAGGTVTGYDGQPVVVADGAVIATNGRFHVKLVEALEAARQ